MGHEKMTELTIGIDISKALLDVATYPDGEFKQFTHDNKGHKARVTRHGSNGLMHGK